MNNSSTATSPNLGTNANELKATYAKIAWRLIPFLVFLFILAWLDRVNVGFAKLHMLQDLQFSEAVYGLGAGIFLSAIFFSKFPAICCWKKSAPAKR